MDPQMFTVIDEEISFKKRQVCDSDFLASDTSTFKLCDFFDISNPCVKKKMDHFSSSLTRFSGLEHECGVTFLRKFKNICVLKDITDENKILALFDIHLHGPASVWLLALPENTRDSWTDVQEAFLCKYNRALDASESQSLNAVFNSLVLEDSLEMYASKIKHYGGKLAKRDEEMQAAFISGLPSQLAFFVRARNPIDFDCALLAAKMGDSFGYRCSTSTGQFMPTHTPPSAGITSMPQPQYSDHLASTSLNTQIESLTNAVRQLQVNAAARLPSSQPRQIRPYGQASARQQYIPRARQFRPREYHPRQFRPPITCRRCGSRSHKERDCRASLNI
jgi:hypothetical protein